jgi:hypothetical protein
MAETRKIDAVVAADVVGSRRMASADEDLILARLSGAGGDLIAPIIAIEILWAAPKVSVGRSLSEWESVYA